MEKAIRALLEKKPKAQVTQNRLFKELGVRPDCTDCAPLPNHKITRISSEVTLSGMLRGGEIPRRLKK
ncbi:hypothetical protein [Phaeobacter sp. J2-8]|uniref:hypothetical protein n=1 Tax=Phaeobacter sp. J2-8 TaxID=2931394 RepID=UPI001FD266D4|nr:hypothetical protein [Phaeobacter sp. J2-8]MCJ7874699.1 hypothetical protein [Phaeobacter sp. J2-8]